ncbi:hypothetical protein IG631_01870 [Alternaria alternata]|nr:hypothetical protein IG631_01870 [Alternaria alternata]
MSFVMFLHNVKSKTPKHHDRPPSAQMILTAAVLIEMNHRSASRRPSSARDNEPIKK